MGFQKSLARLESGSGSSVVVDTLLTLDDIRRCRLPGSLRQWRASPLSDDIVGVPVGPVFVVLPRQFFMLAMRERGAS
jgi:hypothetical protein